MARDTLDLSCGTVMFQHVPAVCVCSVLLNKQHIYQLYYLSLAAVTHTGGYGAVNRRFMYCDDFVVLMPLCVHAHGSCPA